MSDTKTALELAAKLKPITAFPGFNSTAIVETALEREALLERATFVEIVADRLDADEATAILKDLKAFTSRIESQREAVKKPVLALGKQIDGLARELTSVITAQYDRIRRIVGDFEAAEAERAEEERREAEAKAAKLAREAEAKARELTREGTPEALTKADQVVGQATAAIAALQEQQAPARQAGTRLLTDWEITIIDLSATLRDHPEYVKLELDLTAVKAALRQSPNLQISGITHKEIKKLSV